MEQRKEQLREKQLQRYRAERDALRQAVAQIASTREGKVFLRWLVGQTGFLQASTRVGPDGEIQPIGTIWNDARRNIWLDLRQVVPPVALAEIEAPSEVKDNE